MSDNPEVDASGYDFEECFAAAPELIPRSDPHIQHTDQCRQFLEAASYEKCTVYLC
jgi:hypothetical protein